MAKEIINEGDGILLSAPFRRWRISQIAVHGARYPEHLQKMVGR